MKEHSETKPRYSLPVQAITALAVILFLSGMMTSGLKNKPGLASGNKPDVEIRNIKFENKKVIALNR